MIAQLNLSYAMGTSRGFSLIEVLIAMALLAITSLLLFSYLQQIAHSDLQQWRLREAWRSAAQALEGNEATTETIHRYESMIDQHCRWRQVEVEVAQHAPLELSQLFCDEIK